MRRIDREEHSVVEGDRHPRASANDIEEQRGIGPVRVAINLLAGRHDRARIARGSRAQMLERILSDFVLVLAQFGPDNFAVAVIVELECEMQIAERDVPLPMDDRHGVGPRWGILHKF